MAAGLRKRCGALDRIRTCGTLLRRQVLYPLSYEGGVSSALLREASWAVSRRYLESELANELGYVTKCPKRRKRENLFVKI